jgi:hypothetical protein
MNTYLYCPYSPPKQTNKQTNKQARVLRSDVTDIKRTTAFAHAILTCKFQPEHVWCTIAFSGSAWQRNASQSTIEVAQSHEYQLEL